MRGNSGLVNLIETYEMYLRVWLTYAIPKYNSQLIREKDLLRLFKRLKPPLGLTDDVKDMK